MGPFTKTDLNRLAEIIREETGNQVQEKNFSMVESRMRTYVERKGLASMDDYWDYFEANEIAEREGLAGLMTTHYTFFFREFIHFEALKKWVDDNADRLKKRHAQDQKPVTLWSAACSRGHEAYSLALFLDVELTKKYGVPFQIYASDIDGESVAYGKNGVYPIKEVNAIPLSYIGTNIKRGSGAVKDFAAMHPQLKSRVQFFTGNLLALPTEMAANSMDVIFCRNVFIYFAEQQVKEIALNLAKRLREGGLFISGVSEPLRFEGWNLPSTGPSIYGKPLPVSGPVEVKPASKTAPAVATAPSLQSTAAAVEKTFRVLVVDDSPTIQKLMTKILSQDKRIKTIEIAGDGGVAADKLKSGKYDLITLDIHMPNVTGIEFLEKFYKKDVHPPVLMISSVNRTDMDLATKALSLGAADYVEKPAMNQIEKSTSEILMKVRSLIERPTAATSVAPTVPAASSAAPSAGKSDVRLSFDHQIGQKLVIPDATKCLRVVSIGEGGSGGLSYVLEGQKAEYRSPATLVVFDSEAALRADLARLTDWSGRPATNLLEVKERMKPNRIYAVTRAAIKDLVMDPYVTQVSLQILGRFLPEVAPLTQVKSVQILCDEPVAFEVKTIEAQLRRKVSDVTPATSFASLSAEYFAMLRQAAA